MEGDVQIFADPECTQYATGVTETVYVRINNPWTGINSGWSRGDHSDVGSFFMAFSPTDEYPDDSVSFVVYNDYASTEDGPYTPGQVVEAFYPGGYDVTGFQKVFSRPS